MPSQTSNLLARVRAPVYMTLATRWKLCFGTSVVLSLPHDCWMIFNYLILSTVSEFNIIGAVNRVQALYCLPQLYMLIWYVVFGGICANYSRDLTTIHYDTYLMRLEVWY
jgi:hypothetical protein